MDGYNTAKALFKKYVSHHSKNCTGKLVGIQISLQIFWAEIDQLRDKTSIFHRFPSAIITAFHNQIPTIKIERTMVIKQITEKGSVLHLDWVPGHKDILGNELVDQQAKAAAQ